MNRTSQMTANISIATGCSDIHSDADRGNTKSVSIVKKWLSSFFPAFNKNMRRETAMLYSCVNLRDSYFCFHKTSTSLLWGQTRKFITNIVKYIYHLHKIFLKTINSTTIFRFLYKEISFFSIMCKQLFEKTPTHISLSKNLSTSGWKHR